MRRDIIKFRALLFATAMLAITSGLWLYNAIRTGESSAPLILALPLLIVIGFAVALALQMHKSIRRGEVVEDELVTKAKMKAAAYSFFTTFYVLILIGWFGDPYFERASQATGLAILINALLFIVLYSYFTRRGNP